MAQYKVVKNTLGYKIIVSGVRPNVTTTTINKTLLQGKVVDGFIKRNTTSSGRTMTQFIDSENYQYSDVTAFQPIYTPTADSSFAGNEMGIGRFHLIGHSLGIAGGIYYSFMKKTGFWKGLGITLIVGIAGGAVGMAVDALVNKQNNNK